MRQSIAEQLVVPTFEPITRSMTPMTPGAALHVGSEVNRRGCIVHIRQQLHVRMIVESVNFAKRMTCIKLRIVDGGDRPACTPRGLCTRFLRVMRGIPIPRRIASESAGLKPSSPSAARCALSANSALSSLTPYSIAVTRSPVDIQKDSGKDHCHQPRQASFNRRQILPSSCETVETTQPQTRRAPRKVVPKRGRHRVLPSFASSREPLRQAQM